MIDKEPETILITDDGKFKLIENVTELIDCNLCVGDENEGGLYLCGICDLGEYFVEIV